jgi:hypothetical protein
MAIDPTRPHWWWRDSAVTPGRAVVVDIDGVIADAQGRQYLLEGSRADWEAFFAACIDDPVVVEVRALLSLLDEAVEVLLVTARPIRVQDLTINWLAAHGLRWDLLVMRPAREFDPAVLFKRAVVDELRDEGFELALAIEDAPEIKDMYVAAGVPCLYLHSGYYD